MEMESQCPPGHSVNRPAATDDSEKHRQTLCKPRDGSLDGRVAKRAHALVALLRIGKNVWRRKVRSP